MPRKKNYFRFPKSPYIYIYIYIWTFLMLAGCNDTAEHRESPKSENVFRIKLKADTSSVYVVDQIKKDNELVYDSNLNEPIVAPLIWRDCIISWGLRIKDKPIEWPKQGQDVKQFTLPDALPSKLLEEIQQKIERENGIELQIVAKLWIPNSNIMRSACNLDPETISQVFSEHGPIDHVKEEGTVETPAPTESSGTPVTEKPKQGQSQAGKPTPTTKAVEPEKETRKKSTTETKSSEEGSRSVSLTRVKGDEAKVEKEGTVETPAPTESSGTPVTEKPKQGQSQSGKATPATKTVEAETETEEKPETETPVPPTEKPTTKKSSEEGSRSVSLIRVEGEGNKIEQVRLLNGSQIHEKDQLQFHIDFKDPETTLENFLEDQKQELEDQKQENDITLFSEKKESSFREKWEGQIKKRNTIEFNCQLSPGKHTLQLIIAKDIFETNITVIPLPPVTLNHVKGKENEIKQVQLINGSKIYQNEQLHFEIDFKDADTTLQDLSKKEFSITIRIFYNSPKSPGIYNNFIMNKNQIQFEWPPSLSTEKYTLKLIIEKNTIAEDIYEIPINIISPPTPDYPQ